jgi:hypothetical protein
VPEPLQGTSQSTASKFARPRASPCPIWDRHASAPARRAAGRPSARQLRHGRKPRPPSGRRSPAPCRRPRAIVEDAAGGRPVDKSTARCAERSCSSTRPVGIGPCLTQPPRPFGDAERRVGRRARSWRSRRWLSACLRRLDRAAPPRHAQPDRRPPAQRREEPRGSSPGARSASASCAASRGTSRLGSAGSVSAERCTLPPESGAGAWPSPVKKRVRVLPRKPQQPEHQRPPVRAAAERLRAPQTAQHVVDMVAHRRAVLRPGIARATRPAGQRLFGRIPPRQASSTPIAADTRARRASWDHFKNAAQHVHLE